MAVSKSSFTIAVKEGYKMKETKQKDLTSVFIVVLSIMMVLTLFNSYMTYNLYTKGATGTGNQAAPTPQVQVPTQGEPQQPTFVQVSEDDDPVLGDKNAKVTIIEFSDYECPFCARFATQTLPQIKDQYVKTGKVKIVFRDFPLSFHANAQKAAEAAECADDQGKYWEYHDKLFANTQSLDVTSLKQYAKDLGLDATKFNSCLDTGKYTAEVKKDFSDGQAVGISGTPSFVINGKLVVGALPFEMFKQEIDAALAQ